MTNEVTSLSKSIAEHITLDVESLRREVKQDPGWEKVRKRITSEALHMVDKVVFDFRRLLTDPSASLTAGKLLWRMLKGLHPQVLIGPGYGATPLLHAIATAAFEDGIELSVLHVYDKSADAEFRGRWVSGNLKKHHVRAIIVDDFMEAGTAYPVVRYGVEQEDLKLHFLAFALFFDMWQPLGSRQLSLAELPVIPLYRRHDIGLSRDAFDARPPLMKGSATPFIDAKPLWRRFVLNESKGHPRKSSPVIADNAVFVADDQSRIWRHDALTGDIEWCSESLARPRKGIVQRLQYADSSLIFGCYDGTITKLDARSGEVTWRWRQDSSVHATPALDLENSRLFINTEQWNEGTPFGHLIAMDWLTGRLIWKHKHGWWPPGSPCYSARENIVVATCNDQTIVAVDADDGRVLWRAETPGLVRGKPEISAGKAFILTELGSLVCYDVLTGNEIWRKRYGAGLQHQFVSVAGDQVFAFDGKWHLLAFHVDDGRLLWMSRLRSPGTWCPIFLEHYLVALSQGGHLAVFDLLLEKKIWEGSIGGRYHQPPAIGITRAGLMLAAASNDEGLKSYLIDPIYSKSGR